MPRPTPPSMSAAATPRTSWRCFPASPSAPRPILPAWPSRASPISLPTTSLSRPSSVSASSCWAWRAASARRIDQKVHPAMVRARGPLANVSGAANGVLVDAGEAGSFFFSGRGAGEAPTASAVIADIVEAAAEGDQPSPVFGRSAASLIRLEPADSKASGHALVSALRGAGCARRTGRHRRSSVGSRCFHRKHDPARAQPRRARRHCRDHP